MMDIAEILYWARRYCDGRATYAPFSFNRTYDRILSKFPEIKDIDKYVDKTLTEQGKFFPYAQDYMYREYGINAVPPDKRAISAVVDTPPCHGGSHGSIP